MLSPRFIPKPQNQKGGGFILPWREKKKLKTVSKLLLLLGRSRITNMVRKVTKWFFF